MFGLTFDKLLIIGVIAAFLLGPERIPHYAAQLGRLVRSLRDMARGATERMKGEMGPEFEDVDWKKLDPRQYDPRRIIRDALLDDGPPAAPTPSPKTSAAAAAAGGAAALGLNAAASPAPETAARDADEIEAAAEAVRRRRSGLADAPPPVDLEAT